MKLVHSNLNQSAEKAAPAKKVNNSRRERVELWMKRQYQKDYDLIVNERKEDIEFIQDYEPGWMPQKTFLKL